MKGEKNWAIIQKRVAEERLEVVEKERARVEDGKADIGEEVEGGGGRKGEDKICFYSGSTTSY